MSSLLLSYVATNQWHSALKSRIMSDVGHGDYHSEQKEQAVETDEGSTCADEQDTRLVEAQHKKLISTRTDRTRRSTDTFIN